MVYCMLYTFSRGAYIAFIAGLALSPWLRRKKFLLLIVFFIFWRSLVPVSVVERIEMTKPKMAS